MKEVFGMWVTLLLDENTDLYLRHSFFTLEK